MKFILSLPLVQVSQENRLTGDESKAVTCIPLRNQIQLFIMQTLFHFKVPLEWKPLCHLFCTDKKKCKRQCKLKKGQFVYLCSQMVLKGQSHLPLPLAKCLLQDTRTSLLGSHYPYPAWNICMCLVFFKSDIPPLLNTLTVITF